MQATLTQSGALYLAHHKSAKRPSAFFPCLNATPRKRAPDIAIYREVVNLPPVHSGGNEALTCSISMVNSENPSRFKTEEGDLAAQHRWEAEGGKLKDFTVPKGVPSR
jgi:hypothetical protein